MHPVGLLLNTCNNLDIDIDTEQWTAFFFISVGQLFELPHQSEIINNFNEGYLINFYKCLPEEQYPQIRNFFFCGCVLIFAAIYIGEKTFSSKKCVVSVYRLSMSVEI